MNIENMKKLRDYIAGLDPRLVRMREWVDGKIRLNGHCGTVACIAGHCWMMARPDDPLPLHQSGRAVGWQIEAWARGFLELRGRSARTLFCDMPSEFREPPANPQTPREREKEWVLRRLDRCIKLGYVPELDL